MSRFRTVLRELIRGKSISRALLAHEAESILLKGRGIDLGAKDGFSAQYRHMALADADITFTDLHPRDESVMKLDVEADFPIASETFDFVLCFFLLEHVFDTRHVLAESFRITRAGGLIAGAVPQIDRYHPDPDDFLRFTRSGITRSLEQAGYSEVETVPIGTGPFSVAAQMVSNAVKVPPLAVPIRVCGVSMDLLSRMLFRKDLGAMYAFSHLFTARKPNA